jgi:enoyl-CoA hydratase
MGNTESVSLEVKDKVVQMTIRRPDALNAIDYDVIRNIRAHLKSLREDLSEGTGYDKYRLLLIRGEGSAFVAGADIKVMHNCSWEEVAQFIRLGQRAMRELESLALPVVAAVDGYAFGGGLELALASDIIVCSDKASLGQPEVNLGLIPGFGGTQRLIHRAGTGIAKRLIFTGETVSGQEAYELGVVDYLFSEGEFEAKLSEVVKTIASKSPLAIAAAKRAIEKGIDTQKTAGLTREVDEFLEVFSSKDCQEGLAAFVEKREVQFKGR